MTSEDLSSKEPTEVHHQHPNTTIAIAGGNKVLSNALSLLLKGVGYDTKLIEGDRAGLADGLLDGVDILLLAPGLSTGVRDALLSVVRGNPKMAQMPVLTLSATAGEALDDESGTLPVPWPSPVAALAQQIEAILDSETKEEGRGNSALLKELSPKGALA